MQRVIFLIFIGFFLLPCTVLAQNSNDDCKKQLEYAEELFAILQEQHQHITLPRAEADQRVLIALQRQVGKLQARIQELEKQKEVILLEKKHDKDL